MRLAPRIFIARALGGSCQYLPHEPARGRAGARRHARRAQDPTYRAIWDCCCRLRRAARTAMPATSCSHGGDTARAKVRQRRVCWIEWATHGDSLCVVTIVTCARQRGRSVQGRAGRLGVLLSRATVHGLLLVCVGCDRDCKVPANTCEQAEHDSALPEVRVSRHRNQLKTRGNRLGQSKRRASRRAGMGAGAARPWRRLGSTGTGRCALLPRRTGTSGRCSGSACLPQQHGRQRRRRKAQVCEPCAAFGKRVTSTHRWPKRISICQGGCIPRHRVAFAVAVRLLSQ